MEGGGWGWGVRMACARVRTSIYIYIYIYIWPRAVSWTAVSLTFVDDLPYLQNDSQLHCYLLDGCSARSLPNLTKA